ncbi:MAG: Ribonuclease HII [Lentisphaerae bacterium ADurb.Bin242]|nr:MAG: Ribonuclease HII [Lentisphaerae bacterium ADurb.Bin242]
MPSRKQKRTESNPEKRTAFFELLAYEKIQWDEGFSFVAGVDEAGRGCMAGPVVAAAVVFTDPEKIPEGINDSKQLTPEKRMELREKLLAEPSVLWAVAEVSPEEIDRINILRATWKAMATALSRLPKIQFALVDGNPVRGLPVPSRSIVKGDARSLSIGAASILAKTHRDLYMEEIAKQYPQYSFEIHKGYCTKLHIEAVEKYGPCPIHRRTFEPVKSILNPPDAIQPDLF